MGIFTTPLEAARAEVERLGAAREKLAQKLTDVSGELDSLRAGAGARELSELLEEGDGSEARNRLLMLDTKVVGLLAARQELITRLVDGYKAVNAAEAGEKRQESVKAEGELKRQTAEDEKALAKAAEIIGGRVCPLMWLQRAQAEFAAAAGAMPVGGFPLDAGVPKAEKLALQARALRQQADVIERRAVVVDGVALGASLEELLENMKRPLNHIVPLEVEVRAWASNAEAVVLAAWRRAFHGTEPHYVLRFEVAWKGGIIIEAKSSCQLQQLDPEGYQASEQRRREQQLQLVARGAA